MICCRSTGLARESVTVELGEDNIMQEICIYITDESADTISVGRISVSDAAESGENQEVCGKEKEEAGGVLRDGGFRNTGEVVWEERKCLKNSKRILQNRKLAQLEEKSTGRCSRWRGHDCL